MTNYIFMERQTGTDMSQVITAFRKIGFYLV